MKKEDDIKQNWSSLKIHTKEALRETYHWAMHWVEKDLDLVMDKMNFMILRLEKWMKKREESIHPVRRRKKTRTS